MHEFPYPLPSDRLPLTGISPAVVHAFADLEIDRLGIDPGHRSLMLAASLDGVRIALTGVLLEMRRTVSNIRETARIARDPIEDHLAERLEEITANLTQRADATLARLRGDDGSDDRVFRTVVDRMMADLFPDRKAV